MKPTHTSLFILLAGLIIGLSSCVTSRIKPYTQVSATSKQDTSSVKIFLLERDIPQNIERLGVVSLTINSNAGMNMDKFIKDRLRKDCQRLGANGAYRTNDGTYIPFVVSYLVFRY